MEWESPLGKELIHWDGQKGKIVGVMKDFNFLSLHNKIEPLYVFLEPTKRNYYLSVKLAGGEIPETIKYLKNKINEFMPAYPFEFSFFDKVFDKEYNNENKVRGLITLFSLIAASISCLGLLGLASYSTERRIKEIGIRKTLGATFLGIVVMLTKEFTKLVLISNVIAWPIAYYFMTNWLQNFAFRTDLGLWTFIISGVIALIIALISVGHIAVKAALSNPVKSLRWE